MKKIFRKNQIIITALALMIAVAGYVSYTQTNTVEKEAMNSSAETVADTYDISDEDTVAEIFTDTEDNTASAENTTEEKDTEKKEETADKTEDKNPGETVLTSASAETVDFAAEVKFLCISKPPKSGLQSPYKKGILFTIYFLDTKIFIL